MIPETAYEAAAEGIYDAAFGQELPEAPIDLARAALEAALPHLLPTRDQIATLLCSQAHAVPLEIIETGLSKVDWTAIREGEADPKEAAAHAIRYAAIAYEAALREQIAADVRTLLRDLNPHRSEHDAGAWHGVSLALDAIEEGTTK